MTRILVACVFLSSLGQAMSFSSDVQMEQFSPVIKENSLGGIDYRVTYIGGYSFTLGPKWRNTSNINVQDKLNIITFVLKNDQTQSFTFTISKTPNNEIGKPLNAEKRLTNSLSKKGVKFSNVRSDSIQINNCNAEWVQAELDNDRMIYMLLMDNEGLSLTGTLGYKGKANNASPQEVINIIKSFRK